VGGWPLWFDPIAAPSLADHSSLSHTHKVSCNIPENFRHCKLRKDGQRYPRVYAVHTMLRLLQERRY